MAITDYIGVGGPIGVICVFLGFLMNAYLAKRKDTREDVKIERESESGIVETTRQALAMARDEMKAVNLARTDDREHQKRDLVALRAEKDTEIELLRIKVTALQAENERLKRGQGT